MQTPTQSIIVVGAGIFGVTAAIELRRRGYTVSLFDAGPLPHPKAASTDISKVIRMDYGADELYMTRWKSLLRAGTPGTAMGEAAVPPGWLPDYGPPGELATEAARHSETTADS